MAESVVITSGTGIEEDRRSESQIESMGLLSQRSVNSHRNAAPPCPAGHGPGMIPIRYLIFTGGMVAKIGTRGLGLWIALLKLGKLLHRVSTGGKSATVHLAVFIILLRWHGRCGMVGRLWFATC